MEIQDKIKKWVVLDNNYKKISNQMKLLRDEKNELSNSIINYFESKNANFPTINISDGKLKLIEIKQANSLTYKFLEDCFEEFFRNYDIEDKNIKDDLIDFIKSKRSYSNNKNIKRTYNNLRE